MTSWQIVRLVAGIFIMLSLALGIPVRGRRWRGAVGLGSCGGGSAGCDRHLGFVACCRGIVDA